MDIVTPIKTDRIGRKIYSPQQRAALLSSFKKSGLTQAEFTRRHGIHWTTFNSWLHGTSSKKLSVKQEQITLRELTVSQTAFSSSAALEVCLKTPSGYQLTCKLADNEELVSLLKSLEAKQPC